MINFKKFNLEEVCEKIIDCPHSTPKWTDHGFTVIRNYNVRDGKLDLSKHSYTDLDTYISRSRRIELKEKDIILTREAPMGEVCMIPPNLKCCMGQRVVTIRANTKKIDPQFLLYSFQSSDIKRQILWNEGTGSTVSNLKIPTLKAIEIMVPLDLSIQKKMIHPIIEIDKKIEANKKINKICEDFIQTLFNSWFINFDPTRAKIEKKGTGLSKKISELFPNSFEKSVFGDIPKGWECKKIGDVMDFNYGTALTGKNRKKGNIPVYGSNGILGLHNEKNSEGPGIIVGRAGNPGTVHWSNEDFFVIDSAFSVKIKKNHKSDFYYYVLKKLKLNRLNTGSAIPGLNRHDAYAQIFINPSEKIIIEFNNLSSIYRDKIEQNIKEINILKKIRDILLPKIISGQINSQYKNKI